MGPGLGGLQLIKEEGQMADSTNEENNDFLSLSSLLRPLHFFLLRSFSCSLASFAGCD